MTQVLQRHKLFTDKSNKCDLQEVKQENEANEELKKELREKSMELQRLKGDELQGLEMDDLIRLEKLVEGGLSRVVKIKELELVEENTMLKQQAEGYLIHNSITMDEEYDVIVLGTGLKECILSGLLSVDGLKVLHMDKNDYYGGESSSINLIQLWKRFRGNDQPPEGLGASREYNVDMIPKFMMANGILVRVLIHANVTKYLNFKAVDGSFVYNKGKIHKVPATDVEALKSPLMGLFEKRRARKFFVFVQEFEESDPKTHEGMDLNSITAKELITKYELEDNTIDFIGHALALHSNDSYLDQPAMDFVKRMKLYAESLARFQAGSPYIYPLYGLGELPQAFARLSAVYGGTYMLNKPQCQVEFGGDGKVIGVTSEGETAKCKKVVCDPSYLPDKVQKVGKVARAICIMSHPIPDTDESHSAQVILPQKQLGRKSDMYLFCCSYTHNVAPKGKYIAFVSAEAETDNPEVELKPGVDLLGPVDEIFFDTYDTFVPTNDSDADQCFISKSYDATTHFESTVTDVLAMYTKITGKVLDLSVDLSAASAGADQ
ncbi:guanosine nucleotide diphosphate dissociation inhibitor [Dorcoceras hygrometricum]|uniref:Guanosine nucleotide diphosphate dissociation inhibitor n=1 Tax=Dorcoceras hygrometricum TaxID=472368 RepID=A0A2Z7AM10_9LAMI|nr:guanosine nucleotide diphosphate dissociation inhibitor [Dorcoceras hygrometricum]